LCRQCGNQLATVTKHPAPALSLELTLDAESNAKADGQWDADGNRLRKQRLALVIADMC